MDDGWLAEVEGPNLAHRDHAHTTFILTNIYIILQTCF